MATVDRQALPLQQFTGFLLRRAYVVSLQHAEACIGEDSSVREVPVLTLVGNDEPMSQRRLGELLCLNRTTTGRLVDTLEAKGWVVRDRDEHDRRSYALRLSQQGRDSLAALHRALDKGEAHLTTALTGVERKRLAAALRLLLADDATTEIPGLGTRCGYLIARAHRTMFGRATAALAPHGLSPRDLGLLSALSSAQPCSQQRLAAILGVSAPAVLGFIDELESRGLVSRRRNAADRRAYDLMLTDSGISKLRAGQRSAVQLQTWVVDVVGDAADEDLRRMLRKIIDTASGGTWAAALHPPQLVPASAERHAVGSS